MIPTLLLALALGRAQPTPAAAAPGVPPVQEQGAAAAPAPPATAGSAPAPACAPHAPLRPATWKLRDLSPDLVQFYDTIATKNGMSLETLLGGLTDSFEDRLYSFEEIQGNLASLKTLISTPSRDWKSNLPATAEPRLEGGGASPEVMVLYLDPTCDLCKRALDMSREAQQRCPAAAPTIVLRAVPTAADASVDSAVFLAKVAAESPGDFTAAFVEIATAANNPAMLPEIESHYLPSAAGRPLRSMPWYDATSKLVEDRRRSFHGQFPKYSTPLVLFRGRVLAKCTSDAYPFDPLHDADVLFRTLQLISQYDLMGR